MQKITLANARNQIFKASYEDNAEYILKSLEGFRATDININSVSGYMQHGATYVNSYYGPRPLTINFHVYASNAYKMYQKLSELRSIFNPLLGENTITYEDDYHTMMIKAVISNGLDIKEDMGLLKVVSVGFEAHNPLFCDVAETQARMADFIGGLRFPHRFPMRFGKRGDAVIIYNRGDVPAPLKCEFNGPAINPSLINETTGEMIKVEAEIEEAEKLIITTEYGNKTVTIHRADGTVEDAYNSIDSESDFISLDYGANRLSFRADIGKPTVYITYRNWYGGI